jgi:hypothetical protein
VVVVVTLVIIGVTTNEYFAFYARACNGAYYGLLQFRLTTYISEG